MLCIKNGNIHNAVQEEPFEVSTNVEQVYIDGVAIK